MLIIQRRNEDKVGEESHSATSFKFHRLRLPSEISGCTEWGKFHSLQTLHNYEETPVKDTVAF